MRPMQTLALLGSTGSIGEQTLDVVRNNGDDFSVSVLTANTKWERLAEQAIEFRVDAVVIADERYYAPLKERLAAEQIEVYAGAEAVSEVCRVGEIDVVVNALVGAAGLLPSLSAVRAGKKLALANKESLVIAGELLMGEAMRYGTTIVPIDSEHSAILQCLVGECSDIRRLVITASGGAFRDIPISELGNVTPEDALRHPTWTMGAKITVDSATMFNKGFEVIEARWLFDVETDKIEVVLHPQSIIHSMVEFWDGAIKAQLGEPDMRVPIAYALSLPQRKTLNNGYFDFSQKHNLTFEPIDMERYPALAISYDVLRRGGTAAATMNGANEVAVAKFLRGEIGFLDIVKIVESALEQTFFESSPNFETLLAADAESRRRADATKRA